MGENDWWQNKHYDKCEEVFDKYLTDTNASVAPWYIIDSGDKKWAELQVLETLCSGIHVAMQNESLAVPILQNVFPLVKMPRLSEVELDKEISEEEYKRELRHLQKKLNALHYRLYRKKIPVVIAYEGWDAAGKGGAAVLTMVAACTASGGMMMRMAWGRMITNIDCQYEKPWLFAASNCPRWMEPMPLRTTSEM